MKMKNCIVLMTYLVFINIAGAKEPAKLPPIYIGGAFNMLELGKKEAKGWKTVRDYGAKLQVHPVGWRGQWQKVGKVVCPNFKSRSFLYEFDIVDPRKGKHNFLDEIKIVESFNMKCEAVFCNFYALEMLTDRKNLVADFQNMVTKPLRVFQNKRKGKNKGLSLYFTFSPVCTGDVVSRANEFVKDDYWIKVAKECGADGVGIDFPAAYWKTKVHRDVFLGYLRSAKKNNMPVLYMTSTRHEQDVADLKVMYDHLEKKDLLPNAWNMNMWHNIKGHKPPLTPEKKGDGTPAGTMTGAALLLYKELMSTHIQE